MIDKTLGKQLIILVRGFHDAQMWINRCTDARIVKCAGGDCWHAATHVFWQDRAEWYPLCDDHRDYGQQWSGSTRWEPSEFSLAVLPDKIDAWLTTQGNELELGILRVEDYDATNWYALMNDDLPESHYFIGDDERGGWRAYVHRLKAGGYCYELEHVFGSFNFRVCTGYGHFGDFETVEACIADAREQQINRQKSDN
jgi:hypothetical protein